MQCIVADEPAMHALAATIAGQCQPGDALLLEGTLGAGKTSFARGFIRALAGAAQEVVSPTFTLLQTYATPGGTIWHFDLYRLHTRDDAYQIGLNDALTDGITLIEWPQLVAADLPQALNIHIDTAADTAMRQVRLAWRHARWQALEPALAAFREGYKA
jgi:tRNA threonylcarbamoyladenosine biosynthesis protein TsaE